MYYTVTDKVYPKETFSYIGLYFINIINLPFITGFSYQLVSYEFG